MSLLALPQAGADGDQVRTVKDDRTICFILALIRRVARKENGGARSEKRDAS